MFRTKMALPEIAYVYCMCRRMELLIFRTTRHYTPKRAMTIRPELKHMCVPASAIIDNFPSCKSMMIGALCIYTSTMWALVLVFVLKRTYQEQSSRRNEVYMCMSQRITVKSFPPLLLEPSKNRVEVRNRIQSLNSSIPPSQGGRGFSYCCSFDKF